MHVYLSGNYLKQDKTRIPNNNNAINIYCVYKLDPIASSRDTTFIIQKMLYLELCKLLKMLILQNMTIKDVVYVLMKHKVFTILGYAEKNFYRNFTGPGKTFMLSLHYNGNNSYLFVNGRQELKFKCKTDQ